MKNLQEIINEAVESTLFEKGISKRVNKNNLKSNTTKKSLIKESYVTQVGKFNLNTERLSDKNKKSHQELLEDYVSKLNNISINLDSIDKTDANLNMSLFRSLKIDESYNHNAAFLHGLFFENISDISSNISVDSLPYMRLSRDFGSFDTWQEDFVACCMSARNGWAVTLYNVHLNRYINTIIDLHSTNVMTGMIPVIVVDCWEHSYYSDYLKDRKKYVFSMMKELNWEVIENRIKKTDMISQVMQG